MKSSWGSLVVGALAAAAVAVAIRPAVGPGGGALLVERPRRPSGPLDAAARPAAPGAVAALPAGSAFEEGAAALNADQIEAAVDAFEAAVRLAPEWVDAHVNLGLVYLRLGRREDALRELEHGARLAREQQALAQAIEISRRIAAVAPESREAARARAFIARIEEGGQP